MTKKSWIEKFQAKKDLPKIVRLDENLARKYKAETMPVPSPQMVYDIMKTVPEGKLITVKEIRKILADENEADTTCPLTTGIFIWIVANASEEMVEKGVEKEVIPYWRTLKSKGELLDKYPGGTEAQKQKLEAEGIPVIRKGKRYFVEHFEDYLFR